MRNSERASIPAPIHPINLEQMSEYVRIDHVAPHTLSAPWTFLSLLEPVPIATFVSRYWGAWPLHIARENGQFYDGLITLAELERYLSMPEVFRRHSITTPTEGYGPPEPPPIAIGDVADRLLNGNSLRIRRLECLIDPSAPVQLLLRDMQNTLQHPIASLSCYVAPSEAVGLGPHHDETEIFTLQVSGEKRWRIYHRVDSNLPGRYSPKDLGTPTYDFTLKAGDLLYLPRGWVHHVTNEIPAFSLTIVFEPIKWTALLDALVANLASTPAFMAPIPAGLLLNGCPSESVQREFEWRRALVQEAVSQIRLDSMVDYAASELVTRMTHPPEPCLDNVFRLHAITLDTLIERRTDVTCHLTTRKGLVVLIIAGGYMLQASMEAEPALRAVIGSQGPFRIVDMHNTLGSAAKLVLAKKLVASGLLRVL